ncbi:DUF1853 family protein [Tenacibaculum sp. S7007]|uniref:DUF1853 family protein n=1 Tax=Tenacibaculum pelagium TaxID=2759527 RepID=A0A839AKX8_9FLAO|nr:DUF1853 family protein [Tenacibaculum pelagium]MBA6155026.1 DUF1853 family protein [Tenacibaculum pelagium]
MDKNSKDIQLQYEGFLKTPFLWHGKGVLDLQQFENKSIKTTSFSSTITQKLRLGKLVERFVSSELQQDSSIKMLSENIQIQEGKRTLGELDCLLLKDKKPIHLEIIYKFYLHDKTVGNSEIEHWIGPNRRDSFIQKLNKLKNKQLPLLYSNQCKPYLEKLNLTAKEIEQRVYFKAQLFVPFNDFENEFTLINNDCIRGFYINSKELQQFSECKFYMPNKHNWLIEPHANVTWLNFTEYTNRLDIYIKEENAPLCWIKKPNGELFKFFVTWW